VLANLELLADTLQGDAGDAARSALRSSQRMRRLVADLLLLARSDAGQAVSPKPCDLADIVVEATSELGPVSMEHAIIVDASPVTVEGIRDELHRVAINLLENALRYTPPGTEIRISTAEVAGEARLIVEDDGPGIAPELKDKLFERFVRGAGDRGGSFGLGLAIVQAVATSHGGSVTLETSSTGHGARFVVRLPLASDLNDDGQDHRPSLETVID
jgi:signal transduction histidine kinase